MARTQLQSTNFDHEEIKSSLIEFLKTTEEFDDFDYEGSAINTIVDLLTRNTTYIAYLANMLANESFIDSAQLRQSIVSHAQKLSYTPRSYTASRTTGTVTVFPADTSELDSFIEMREGTIFMSSVGNESFTFTTNDVYTLELVNDTYYEGHDIQLFQGQRVSNEVTYNGNTVKIPNQRIDTSTIKITVIDDGIPYSYTEAKDIDEVAADQSVFFLSEGYDGLFQIDFGRDVIGREPSIGSSIKISYVVTEQTHANGLKTAIAASKVDGNSNVTIEFNQPAWGGYDKEDKESIRFFAPKLYQSQNRTLTSDDFIPIVQSKYPFIRSMITWGGEENNPPRYGNVLMSFILDDEQLLTQSVKDDILEYLKDRGVGSVTPIIVDPEAYGLDITVEFAYDNKLTSKSFNQLGSELKDLLFEYNNSEINSFGRYFNDALVIKNIMNIRGISTANVILTAFKDFPVLRFSDPAYEIDFLNPIQEESLYMEGFSIEPNSEDNILWDSNGIVYVTYNREGVSERTIEIGEVDYENGVITFSANFLQEEDTLRLYVRPKNENFMVDQNKYVYINSVDYKRF